MNLYILVHYGCIRSINSLHVHISPFATINSIHDNMYDYQNATEIKFDRRQVLIMFS